MAAEQGTCTRSRRACGNRVAEIRMEATRLLCSGKRDDHRFAADLGLGHGARAIASHAPAVSLRELRAAGWASPAGSAARRLASEAREGGPRTVSSRASRLNRLEWRLSAGASFQLPAFCDYLLVANDASMARREAWTLPVARAG